MRALYSLVSRLRTLYALAQGLVTFAFAGPAAMTPVQKLILGCGLCIALRILVPAAGADKMLRSFVDRQLNRLAVISVIAMAAAEAAQTCIWAGHSIL